MTVMLPGRPISNLAVNPDRRGVASRRDPPAENRLPQFPHIGFPAQLSTLEATVLAKALPPGRSR